MLLPLQPSCPRSVSSCSVLDYTKICSQMDVHRSGPLRGPKGVQRAEGERVRVCVPCSISASIRNL